MGATAYTPQDARPTQSEHPWRATARTLFAGITAFAAMWAVIVEAIGLDPEWQWVSASLVVSAAITRVLALPAVEEFLRRFFPWLAAAPPPPVNVPDRDGTVLGVFRDESGSVQTLTTNNRTVAKAHRAAGEINLGSAKWEQRPRSQEADTADRLEP